MNFVIMNIESCNTIKCILTCRVRDLSHPLSLRTDMQKFFTGYPKHKNFKIFSNYARGVIHFQSSVINTASIRWNTMTILKIKLKSKLAIFIIWLKMKSLPQFKSYIQLTASKVLLYKLIDISNKKLNKPV